MTDKRGDCNLGQPTAQTNQLGKRPADCWYRSSFSEQLHTQHRYGLLAQAHTTVQQTHLEQKGRSGCSLHAVRAKRSGAQYSAVARPAAHSARSVHADGQPVELLLEEGPTHAESKSAFSVASSTTKLAQVALVGLAKQSAWAAAPQASSSAMAAMYTALIENGQCKIGLLNVRRVLLVPIECVGECTLQIRAQPPQTVCVSVYVKDSWCWRANGAPVPAVGRAIAKTVQTKPFSRRRPEACCLDKPNHTNFCRRRTKSG